MSNGYSVTRYRFHSPAYRFTQRVARSAYVRDVRSQLHVIPETIGALAAVYVLWALVHLAAVMQAWAVTR